MVRVLVSPEVHTSSRPCVGPPEHFYYLILKLNGSTKCWTYRPFKYDYRRDRGSTTISSGRPDRRPPLPTEGPHTRRGWDPMERPPSRPPDVPL